MSRFTRFMGLVAVFAILSLALGGAVAQDDGNTILFNWLEGDIPHLDPAFGTDTATIQIVLEIFPGLTLVDPGSLETKPGLASSWDVSDDGLTYTFHLMEGVPWVKYNPDSGEVEQVLDADGNPRMVTASDFAYGMKRGMDPRIAEYYGSILAQWVVGGLDYYNALADVAEDAPEDEVTALVEEAAAGLGITVIDDYTIEIVAPRGAGFLSALYGMWAGTAQPQWVIEEFGDQWTEAANVVSYGPFAVSEWNHEENLDLITNPFWVGTDDIPAPSVDGVHGTMLSTEAALANYEAGLMHTTGVPITDLERIKADPVLSLEYATGPRTCTYGYTFNTAYAPFDDVRVRRAFSMAINRQDLIDNVTKGGQLPALFWSYPDLNAAPQQGEYPDLAIQENDDLARELLDEYIAENGPLPPIVMTMNQSSGHVDIANAIIEMWRETLGVEIDELLVQDWAVYLDATRDPENAPPIIRYAWCQDYPDAHNFLFDVWHSETMGLGTNWSNEEFDALLEEGMAELDPVVRTEIYAEAEYILTNGDAVVVPIYYYTSHRLTVSYVDRPLNRTGIFQFEKWTINQQ